MKIFTIDYGKKRVGLAVSDPAEQIALALPIYQWQDDGNDAARLAELALEQEAEEIVVGGLRFAGLRFAEEGGKGASGSSLM